jgi:hypothetical protein
VRTETTDDEIVSSVGPIIVPVIRGDGSVGQTSISANTRRARAAPLPPTFANVVFADPLRERWNYSLCTPHPQVVVGATVVTLTGFTYFGQLAADGKVNERVYGTIPRAQLRSLVMQERVSVRLCDDWFVIGPDGMQALRELSAQMGPVTR